MTLLLHFASLISSPPGNDSSVDGLVNFEKLRMIAKEIRHVVRLTSANMDPALMFRQRWADDVRQGSALYVNAIGQKLHQGPLCVCFLFYTTASFNSPKGGGTTGHSFPEKMSWRHLKKTLESVIPKLFLLQFFLFSLVQNPQVAGCILQHHNHDHDQDHWWTGYRLYRATLVGRCTFGLAEL